jgi:glycosyltransferase involved in cell wall biosynthesis
MKFSIIVPVYNAQKYLQSCCNAILGQSYQNFELILVDDGSTDHSGAVCDYIVESIPEKCVVLHTINQGPLLARQTGIRAATGDVLVFVDSDDCIREDMLKSLADSFQATDCDMILFNASDKDDYSRTFCNCPFQHFASVVDGEKKRIYYNMVYSEIPNAVCLKATKRHCFNEFPDFSGFSYVKNGEDLLMSLYMVTAAKKIVYLDENLY